MANTGSLRFAFTNRIATATLKNGTGGGAPALDEVAPWVTTNAQDKDRTHVWQQQSGGGFIEADFDLTGAASNVSISLAAVLGHRGAPNGAAGVSSCTIFTSTNANGYPPVAASSWTSQGNFALTGLRDNGLVFNAVSCRYIRFELLAGSTFTIGRLFAGAVDLDLGVISSPGRQRMLVKPMLINEVGANPTKTRYGDNHYAITLPYNTILPATLANLRTVASKDDPFLMIDWDGTFFEGVLADDGAGLGERLMFDVDEQYDAELVLRTLG